MTFDVLIAAGPVITLHVVAATLAVLLGPMALYRRSRDIWHRVAGVAWVMCMLVVATSSLFIHEARQVGAFSIIHGLAVLTLVGLCQGMWALHCGNVRLHGRIMRLLYLQALILAGIFTFLPGRRMSAMIFPGAPELGFGGVMAIGAVIGVVIWQGGRRRGV
jgi:uncharacterized membrane protein